MKTSVVMIQEKTNITDSKKREVLIEGLGCWFIKSKGKINASCPDRIVLLVKKTKYSKFLKICKDYPMILIEDRLVTVHNTVIEGYSFFPPVEFATEEVLYIKQEDTPEYVDVILDSYKPLEEEKEDFTERQTKVSTVTKTYLMLSNSTYTKIGKSFNPYKREATLQYENPTISLLAICDVDVERELHEKYSEKRHRGEWFDLSKKDINKIIKDYNFKVCKL